MVGQFPVRREHESFDQAVSRDVRREPSPCTDIEFGYDSIVHAFARRVFVVLCAVRLPDQDVRVDRDLVAGEP